MNTDQFTHPVIISAVTLGAFHVNELFVLLVCGDLVFGKCKEPHAVMAMQAPENEICVYGDHKGGNSSIMGASTKKWPGRSRHTGHVAIAGDTILA